MLNRAYWLPLLLVVLAGAAGVAVFGYWALVDWAELREAYPRLVTVAADRESSVKTIVVADAQQNIHRINVFAEGVWALLSAILAAIGLHGLYAGRNPRPTRG